MLKICEMLKTTLPLSISIFLYHYGISYITNHDLSGREVQEYTHN